MNITITTAVSENFQHYIPLWVWCINRAYPQYKVKVFLTDKALPTLTQVVKDYGLRVDLVGGEFEPGVYQARPRRFGASVRYLLFTHDRIARHWGDTDFLYITDSDLMICAQQPPLADAHIKHMDKTGLSYSNMLRDPTRFADKHMTGLHFCSKQFMVEVADVCTAYDSAYKVVGDKVLDGKPVIHDERLLYQIVRDSNLPMPRFLLDDDFNAECHQNYVFHEYRPWHGLNVGRAFDPRFPDNFVRKELTWFRALCADFAKLTEEPGFIACANWLERKAQISLAKMIESGGGKSEWTHARMWGE